MPAITRAVPFSRPSRPTALVAGLSALVWHRILIQTGAGMLGLFLPIFLFQLFDGSVAAVMWYALVYYAASGIAEPLGARLMTRIGVVNALRAGTVLYALFLGSLALGGIAPDWAVALVSLALLSAWHVVYWVPYHTEFAEEGRAGLGLGRTLGIIAAAGSLVGIVLPSISGWVIGAFGYSILLALALLMVLASLLTIGSVRAGRERYEFGFAQTFRELFSTPRRRFLVTFALEGAESVVGYFLWPIFLFQLLRGEYVVAGIVTTVVGLLSVCLQLVVGRALDATGRRQRLLSLGMNLSAAGWALKALVETAAQVVLFGTLHGFALVLMRMPFETLMYAKAADAGHYVDEYTVLREMALSVGRVIILALLLALGSAFQFWIAFLIVAAVTFAFGRMSRVPPTFATDGSAK